MTKFPILLFQPKVCWGILLLFLAFLPDTEAQSNFRIGVSGGFGSTRLDVKPIIATTGDDFGSRFSTTVPLGLMAGWFKPNGLGVSTGLEFTLQEMRAGYGDRPGEQEEAFFTPRNATEAVPRISIPIMAHYRKSISQTMPLSMQFGAGVAVDFYDAYSGAAGSGFGIDTTDRFQEVFWASQYEVLHTVSASARLEASIGLDFTRGSRLELGSIFSLGLQKIYEGEFYYYENVSTPSNFFTGDGLSTLIDENTPLDQYHFSSRGSYLAVYLRYWLPRLSFLNRKESSAE